jgi:hypothetical protein
MQGLINNIFKGYSRKIVNMGLLATLTASLAALAFDKRGLHGLCGLAFLGLSLSHVIKHKKGLIN